LDLKRKKIIALVVPASLVILLDQISKYAIRTIPELQNWTIIDGWLAFNYTQNPGMALGLDWLSTPVISIIAICAVAGILGYVFYTLKHVNILYMACMGLVVGGAIGNIIDRLILAKIESYGGVLEGHVVDFIHFNLEVYGYPVFPYIFNVADTAISVAIILLIIFNRQIMPVIDDDPEDDAEEQNEKKRSIKNKWDENNPPQSGTFTLREQDDSENT